MQVIAQYFQQRSCRHCAQSYTADGIEFIRQEPGVIVVRVVCSSCGQPLGIALVGMNTSAQQSTCQHGRPGWRANCPAKHPAEWTKRDAERLSGLPKISYDDVLEAHEFFSQLGNDWTRLLPKLRQRNAG